MCPRFLEEILDTLFSQKSKFAYLTLTEVRGTVRFTSAEEIAASSKQIKGKKAPCHDGIPKYAIKQAILTRRAMLVNTFAWVNKYSRINETTNARVTAKAK